MKFTYMNTESQGNVTSQKFIILNYIICNIDSFFFLTNKNYFYMPNFNIDDLLF